MKSIKNKNKKMDKKKKIIIGVILLLLICGGIIAGIILLNNKEEPKQEEKAKDTILLKEDLKFEINSEITLLSLVSEDNKVKILSDDEKVDTSTLGEKEITIKYEVEDSVEEKTVTITIVDTQAPTIEYEKELSTKVGTKIDLLKGVKVSDNSKEELKATVLGDYDINKEGTYNLKYVVVDSSNNKKEEEFTLKVSKKSTTSSNSDNSSTTKPQTNNKNNSNTNNGYVSSGKDPYALLEKYEAIYGAQLTDSPKEFSPETGVNIWTIPVKWHYEWNSIYERWDVVTDLNGFMSGSEETAKKLYPVPNRPGTDTVVVDENGVSHHTPEKTQIYSAYRYAIETY